MKLTLFTLAGLCYALVASAQTTHSFGLRGGLNVQHVLETKFTSTYRGGVGLYGAGFYLRTGQNSLTQIAVTYAGATLGGNQISSSNISMGQLKVTHLRKIGVKGKFYLGSYLDGGRGSNEREGDWENNNISIQMPWASFGAALNYHHRSSEKWRWRSGLSLPLLSYFGRLDYAHDFEVNRFGSIDRFLNIEAWTGITLPTGRGRWRYGLHYRLRRFSIYGLRPLTSWGQSLCLTIRRS